MMWRVLGIESRALEGDEISEEQRAWVGGGGNEQVEDDELLSEQHLFQLLSPPNSPVLHLMPACSLLAQV